VILLHNVKKPNLQLRGGILGYAKNHEVTLRQVGEWNQLVIECHLMPSRCRAARIARWIMKIEWLRRWLFDDPEADNKLPMLEVNTMEFNSFENSFSEGGHGGAL